MIRLMSCALALATILAGSLMAAPFTTINSGTVTRFSSHTELDLEGNIIYAVDLSGQGSGATEPAPPRTIGGVTFQSNLSPITGYSDSSPTRLNNWASKPTTTGPDADAMNSLLHDIDCCQGSANYSFAVPEPGLYQLQILWKGNGETRVWDIEVEGQLALDEISSNGVWDQTVDAGQPSNLFDNTQGVVFTQLVNVTDGSLDIGVGQLFTDGNQIAADRNYILSGFVVEYFPPLTPEPGSLALAAIALGGFGTMTYRRRRRSS